MARKITASLYMTLDGRGAFPKYPGSDRETKVPNDMWREMWIDRFDDVTTVIMGRRSFTGHRRVWTEKARQPDDAQYLVDYSRWLDRVDKVCLSTRLRSPGWENSRIMKGDLAKIVAKLKREKGGNIIAEGGPRLILEFIRRESCRRLLDGRPARHLRSGSQLLGRFEQAADVEAPLLEDDGGWRAHAPLRIGPREVEVARRRTKWVQGALHPLAVIPRMKSTQGRGACPPS